MSGPSSPRNEAVPSQSNHADESTPLLAAYDHATQQQPHSGRFLTWPAYFTPLAICLVFCLVADLSSSIIDIPEVRLLEMTVCRDFYRIHDPKVIGPPPLSYVDEKLCKLEEIQSNLAYLRAIKGMLTVLPGISRPSDRYDRWLKDNYRTFSHILLRKAR
jgi:hypothetical protein